jgi:hypothetical protein
MLTGLCIRVQNTQDAIVLLRRGVARVTGCAWTIRLAACSGVRRMTTAISFVGRGPGTSGGSRRSPTDGAETASTTSGTVSVCSPGSNRAGAATPPRAGGARTPLALRIASNSEIRSLTGLTSKSGPGEVRCTPTETRHVRGGSPRTADDYCERSRSQDGNHPRRSQESTENAVSGTVTLSNPHLVVLSLERKHLPLSPDGLTARGVCHADRACR